MPTPVNAVCVVTIDLREISGIAPGNTAALNTRVDFSPNRILHVEDGGADYWLTRNIKRVSLATGTGTVALRPNDAGTAYEVQERGFRGARHGYVVVPDLAAVNYGDLVWVDPVTLDPLTPPSPAWLAALAVETAARIAGDATKQPLDSDLTAIAGLTATTDNVIQSVAGAWASRTMAQLKAVMGLVKGDVGLGDVDNTSDANKPVSTAQAAALARSHRRGHRKVSLLGASVATNNGNSSLAANPGGGNPSGWLDLGPATWCFMALGWPVDIVANPSQGGLTSAQILTNTTAALAPSPDYVLGHDWWINDIVTGVSKATSQANITAIIAACNSAGATVILTDFPGVVAETTTAMKVQHAEMVAWLESIQGPGFLFVPVLDAVIDITTGTFEAWATYDGTHPSPRGAHAMGERLAEHIRHLFPNSAIQSKSLNSYAAGVVGGSPYELMGNPMITGVVTGGLAVNFSLSGSGSPVGSVVAATDFPNLKWQRVTLGADGLANLVPALVTGAGLTYSSVTLVPGTTKTRMQFEFRMPGVSAPGKWACVTARQYYAPASNSVYALQDTSNVGTDQGLVPDDNAIFLARSPAAVIPVGTTSLADVITIYGLAGAVIDVRRVSVAIQP